jgi:hypothetical protein
MFSPILATAAMRSASSGFRLGPGRQLAADLVGESAEDLVAGDEIGFAVDFHQDAGPGAGLDVLGDDAFLGCAGGFFGGGGLPFLAQEVHGGLDVALGFGQRFFAVHQARAGHFAQLAYISSSKFSHNVK